MGLDAMLEYQLVHWSKFQKLHIHSLTTTGEWGGDYTELIFGLQAVFAKLPYLAMKHGKWPKFRKLHIYSLCTPVGRNWAYFPSMGTGFRDTGRLLKLPYLGMKLGHGPKWQKLHIYSFSPPRGRNSKLRSKLGSLYWEWFLRYGQILKIAIFAHETWPLAKVPEIAHILPKLPHESQISLRLEKVWLGKKRGTPSNSCYNPLLDYNQTEL